MINRLTEIIDSGRVSHAQMLLGSEQDGSVAMAWAYMQYLCCDHRQHYTEGDLRADSCGECPQCRKIASLQHPDLHLVFPNAANDRVKSNPNCAEFQGEYRDFLLKNQGTGSLEDWFVHLGIDNKQAVIREADAADIVHTLGMKAYEGGWRMLTIWKPSRMNPSAANELLKTLEEPMPRTLIMLIDDDTEGILSTILSRVQMVRLRNQHLGRSAEETAQFAPLMVEWLRMLFKLKMRELSAQVEKMAAMGREQQKQFLSYVLDVMRDCFLRGTAGLPCELGSGDAKFDAMFPTMVTVNNIELINDALNDALFAIGRNAYGKIVFMELSFRISKALKKR